MSKHPRGIADDALVLQGQHRLKVAIVICPDVALRQPNGFYMRQRLNVLARAHEGPSPGGYP
jgi:hypothetical protein